ncbi:MAG: glucose-1-phosphate cytidylyltransferase [Micrococcales bacterium]|nr:MAG: glucose-1-phosphate cytidylyltransferase [Micrococcales bacterium]PIE26515.1 MAG: glucose-1-phosphate cytidylyltransferase [Micrococcales bacterium]
MADTAGVVPADVPVVILCGGMGTRLREASEKLPKPLVEIGGMPIVWHIMKTYRHYGHRRFVLALGYKSEMIKEYFLNYRIRRSDFTLQMSPRFDAEAAHVGNQLMYGMEFLSVPEDEDWEITFAETGLKTATATRLRKVDEYLGDAEHFAITYGDGVGAVDISAVLAHHVKSGAVGTVTGVHPSSRYGEMNVNGNMVAEFNEKPTLAEGWVNGGYFVFKREFIDSYTSGDPDEMLEHAPLQQLARDGGLTVYEHTGFWMGMDTFRDWTELNQLWDSGEAEWKVWND